MRRNLIVTVTLAFFVTACATSPSPPHAERRFFPYPNSRIFTYEGLLVHYREWPAVGEPRGSVLLVHGLGGSTFSFRSIVEPLKQLGFDVLAVDLPGFGYSSRSKYASFDSQFITVMMWDLLRQSNFASSPRWHLLGHSMGSRTITMMAASQPEAVSSITFVDPSVFPTERRWVLARIPPGSWIARRYIKTQILTYSGVEGLLLNAYGRGPTDAEIRGHLEPLLIKGTTSSLLALLGNTRRQELDFAAIRAPTLILWGEKDRWLPPARGAELIERLPVRDLVVIDGAAHCPLETHADVSLAAIEPFLDLTTKERTAEY